jgi:hypothetical protein
MWPPMATTPAVNLHPVSTTPTTQVHSQFAAGASLTLVCAQISSRILKNRNDTYVFYTTFLAQIKTGYFPDFFKSLATLDSLKKKKLAEKIRQKMKNTSAFETNTYQPSYNFCTSDLRSLGPGLGHR